jgi:hypothetical protein
MSNWLKSARPWIGLYLGVMGWFVDHQVGSDTIFHDCSKGGPQLTVGVGVACGLVVALGGGLSWTAGPASADASGQNRRFASLVGAGSAGLFLLAIIFQSMPGVILPACQR